MSKQNASRYANANDAKPKSARTEPKSARTEPKIRLEPMRYKFTKLTPAQTLTQIAEKTQGFYDLSVRSADWIQRDIRSREFSSFGSYPAPENPAEVEEIVGEENYYLQLTMKKHDVAYMCYDENRGEFHLWGEYQCCIRALNELRYRIEKIKLRTIPKGVIEPVPVIEFVPAEFVPAVPSSPTYSPSSPSYCPMSPILDAPAELVPEFSSVVNEQMKKMGFVNGSGLGAHSTGRKSAIDPVADLGGRLFNTHCGLGFTEPAPLEPAPLEPAPLEPAPLEPAPLEPAPLEPAPLEPAICIHNYTQYYNQETDRMPSLFPECACESRK